MSEPVKAPVQNAQKPPVASASKTPITSDYIQSLMNSGKVAEAVQMLQAVTGLQALQAQEALQLDRLREQEQRLLAVDELIAVTESRQEACTHTKPNNSPALGGIRVSSGAVVYVCLNCNKLWTDQTLPPYMRANMPPIGGPG